MAAAELGLSEADFLEKLRRDQTLTNVFANFFRDSNATVKRDTFKTLFPRLVKIFGVAETVTDLEAISSDAELRCQVDIRKEGDPFNRSLFNQGQGLRECLGTLLDECERIIEKLKARGFYCEAIGPI